MEELAGKVGVEPTLAESESAVLPLDDFPSEIDARTAVIELVRRAGLEPATSWVETRNSGSTELTPHARVMCGAT